VCAVRQEKVVGVAVNLA